ncbi:MAG TPA: hypothetical protein VM261_28515 [Kofleriaceae bacterium]|nr:hypothetical protein [Kofleriaceae bacterium]
MLKHLGALMTLPSAPGNAGEDYLAVMNELRKPDANYGKALKPESREALLAAAADPAFTAVVARMRSGAAKRECALVGTLVPWNDGPDPFAKIELPSALTLLAYAALPRFSAQELAAAGKIEEAKRALEPLVWMGWHLQKEPVLLYNVIGISLSTEAADQLAELETDSTRSGRWRVLSGMFRARRYEDYNDRRDDFGAAATLDPSGVDRLAAVVDDPAALPGVRAESMRLVAIAHLVKSADVLPTPQQRAHLERWTRLESPVLRSLAVRLSAVLDLDPMGRYKQHQVYAEEMQ